MSILQKIDRLHQAIAWQGEIPISNRYTAGLAGERFFREIKERGRIVGTHCPACDLIYVPAAEFCERCFSQLNEWVEVSSQGWVFTYTVLFRDLDDKPLESPAILAYVKLDGSDGGLVHQLGEVEPEDVFIGMEVEAVFKPPEEREGSILDIQYFRPVAD